MPKGNKKLKKYTKRVVATFTDAVLAGIFYNLEFAMSGSKGVNYWRLSQKTEKDLEDFNYQTISRAFRYIRRKGFIQVLKEKTKEPKITKAGKDRLSSILPQYDEKRTWDGIIYLTSYDIPIENNRDRNILREFLKTIGCGRLQESLWITPYNPKKLLQGFIEEKNLHGTILVSHMGKDGSVGDMELPELIENVYQLSDLNNQYAEFISNFKKRELPRSSLIFEFLSVLREDPQLPFELLPEDWVGDEAYECFLKLK